MFFGIHLAAEGHYSFYQRTPLNNSKIGLDKFTVYPFLLFDI